ncbi:hypothetical protein TCDM_01991 [Trypanosoma cruzi Dm28c]|uniref:Uncharacterized protein n=2 Tax=Trypanosoma cruzi TaxID=5693 RepID=V5DP83_TRYCR|nr:hypothetical protein TCDM_01991 [Trypanosoma cruzi Dm28c]KAF8283741.1 hypothetical protein TcBrA4_0056320 [Trypanosoma cruzi]
MGEMRVIYFSFMKGFFSSCFFSFFYGSYRALVFRHYGGKMAMQRARGVHLNGGDNKSEGTELSISRVIRAVQGSKSHKLSSINALLQTVVQSAKNVVKGTDSQRRFNAQFSEFCRASLVGISDLEDAVYTLEKADGVFGNDSSDEQGVKSIGAVGFVKEVAKFISSQTSALGVQYLEHVGISAVAAATKTQQLTTTETKRGSKRGRFDDTRQRHVDYRSSPRKRMGASPSLAPAWETDALLLSSPANKSTLARGGATDSYHGAVKLSVIPELSMWLQPWNLSLPNAHGVALDRVMTERAKSLATAEDSLKPPDEVSVFDICTAVATAEVLRLWEARECLLSTGLDRATASSPVPTGKVFPPIAEEVKPMFFPKSDLRARAWVPTQVMVDLVHYGISSLAMPFKDVE